jgi:hypothetical protein
LLNTVELSKKSGTPASIRKKRVHVGCSGGLPGSFFSSSLETKTHFFQHPLPLCWDNILCSLCANDGYLNFLIWASQNGCPLPDELVCNAAGRGNIPTLQWAVEHGTGWCKKPLVSAVWNSHTHMLMWAIEKNYWVPDNDLHLTAAQKGDIELIKFLEEQGCMVKHARALTSPTFKVGHVHMLKYAKEKFGDFMWQEIRPPLLIKEGKNTAAVLKWIIDERGAEFPNDKKLANYVPPKPEIMNSWTKS